MTLYETAVPYLDLDNNTAPWLVITNDVETLEGVEGFAKKPDFLTLNAFLDLKAPPRTAPYSAILISGIFGQKPLTICNAVLEKSTIWLKDNGVLALDIQPVEKLKLNALRTALQDPDIVTEDAIISRQALEAAFRDRAELLEFKDSRSMTVPDIYVFRDVSRSKPSHLGPKASKDSGQKKRGIFDRLKFLAPKKSSINSNAGHADSALNALRRSLSGKYIPATPRVLLLSPTPGLTQAVQAYLRPKTIAIYGGSSPLIREDNLIEDGISYKGEWADIAQEANASAEFIFVGEIAEGLTSAGYFKLLGDIARIRNRGGCVFLKQDLQEFSHDSRASFLLSKTWPLDFAQWAKGRDSSVKVETVSMGSDHYMCVRERSPYGPLIRADHAAGETSKALQKFKNYTTRNFLTIGEAAKIVRVFSELGAFCEALLVFCNHYGVVAASRFGLIEFKHDEIPLIDIVQSFESLINGEEKNEAIIFDLMGEFYRLSDDFNNARKYWIKALFQTQSYAAGNQNANILVRKLRLNLPCEIDCKTSKIINVDPLVKNTVPKTTVILAESKVKVPALQSLADRFNGTLVFTPNFKSDMENPSKTDFKPLMGLIPENSDVNRSSHEYAETISQQIIKALIEDAQGTLKIWLKKHQSSVALTIEDFLARHLLIIEAYAEAANSNPDADILLAGSDLGYFSTSLNLLLSRLSHETVWLHSDLATSDLNEYQGLFERKTASTPKSGAGKQSLGDDDWFERVSEIYAANVDDYFSVQNINMDKACFVLGNLAHRYFGESVVTLAGALYEKGEVPIIIDSSTTRRVSTDMTSLWRDCHLDDKLSNNIPVMGMLRPKINDKTLIEGLAGVRKQIERIVESLPLKYRGIPASFAFSRLVASVLARDIPILLYSSLFSEKLISLGHQNRVAALSTREPHDHIMAETLKKSGIPLTLVQCTDILRHPRYKKPVADHVTAIDQTAFETFEDYLGIPKTAITITDSPRSHINFHPDRVKTLMALLDNRGLAVNPLLRVLFTTRTGNLDKIVEALDKVARHVSQQPGVQLIVKMHPRETSLRLAAYAKVLKAYNIGGAANILDQGTAETLILVSDCVISFPSNVVRVAMDIGKPVLIYRPGEVAGYDTMITGDVRPFIAQTPKDLTLQLEDLFDAGLENKALKKGGVNSTQTLTRICDAVVKQGRSTPVKRDKDHRKIIKQQNYSSLSFKELSTLIKTQGDQSNEGYADIALFERSLRLAKDEADYVSILSDLAKFGPPILRAAEFFAELSKSAAGLDGFYNSIASLASETLANYAAQLEYCEGELDAAIILASAQSCLAAGQFEAALSWYDFGKAHKRKTPLRIRIENERLALKAMRWRDGKEDGDYIEPDIKRVIIVAERGTDPHIYTSIFPDAEIDIYFDGKAGETLGDRYKENSKSSRDVLHDRAPEIKTIIGRANSLAKLIAGQTLKKLKDSPHINWLKDVRPAIEMELRAGLITQLRRDVAFSKAIEGPYDAVLMACNTPSFLALFSDNLEDIKTPIYVLGASQSPARRRAFGAARRQGLRLRRDKQESLLETLKATKSKDTLTSFDNILNAMVPRVSLRHEEKSIIAITSWRITTIKDGCLSLLDNFPQDVPITIFDTSRHIANAARFLVDITDYAEGTVQDIRPFSAQYHNIPKDNLRELKNSALAKSIYASVRGTQEGKTLPHALQLGVWNQVGTLLYKTLPMLYDLHIQVSSVCAHSSASALMLMPGRDAESLTAQNAVQKFGVTTTDVQTAYFSRQHIYTAPQGDIVTAMDEWSKDLFVEWFKLPEDKIHILGTSRFDRFSKLRLSQDTAPQTPKVRPHICVATQPIQSGLTKAMLTFLNDLYVSGTDFDCTVKLHPRQSESIISEIESLAGNLHKDDRLTITKQGDLAQILLASDMVVTAFSNVAIEAALMDRPVLITNFTGADSPVPFMDYGIAEEARTQEEFQALAKRILYDEAFQSALNKKRHSYFERYPSQWRGEAGKDTAALILESLQKPMTP